MTKLAPEWIRNSDPVIRSPARYRWTTAPACIVGQQRVYLCYDCLCLMALFRAIRLLIQDWAVWPVWTGMIPGDCRTITWEVGWIRGLITPCDVNCLCAMMNRRIKGMQGDVVVEMTDRVDDNRLQRCADACEDSLGVISAGGTPTLVIGRFGCVRASVGCCDWLKGCAVIVVAAKGDQLYKVYIMGRIFN